MGLRYDLKRHGLELWFYAVVKKEKEKRRPHWLRLVWHCEHVYAVICNTNCIHTESRARVSRYGLKHWLH